MFSLYNSKLWMEDLDRTLASLPILEELAGKRVLITGGAGLVLSPVVDLFFRYNETHDTAIEILAAGRWIEEMQGRFGEYCEKPYFHFVPYDAAKTDNQLTEPADYIIHGASNASPDMIVREPVETMMSNFMGLKALLDYAKESGTKRLLYVSSSEIYGKKEDARPYREGEYGYIDLLSARNSYSVGKRAAETLCVSYQEEYGVESVIVRPGHIYGPTASPQDVRVASAWAYAAARGEDIVMKSEGKQLRSYCHCLDTASAVLTVLLRGEASGAYNISNPDAIVTIRDMAELLSKAGGVELRMELPTEAERKGFNPMSNSALESEGLQGLGWKGLFDAPTGCAHTVQILKEAGAGEL
jgi:nucleoside-diphosphate-sugar epimerase